jgi:hypothetical protein
VDGTFTYAGRLAASFVCIWFVSWSVRRRYELDCELTVGEKVFRWTIVAAGFGLSLIPGKSFEPVRLIAGLTALALLAFPNLVRVIFDLRRRAGGSTL